MRKFLSCLLFSCVLISAKAQPLDPSDVLKQDGVLRISDGSSYYEFHTNGTFKSFPVGKSGRCFDGTWTSNTDPNSCHFTVRASMSWMNGITPIKPSDDWKIVFAVYGGTRHPAERFHPATFDCYFIIDELTSISKSDK